MAARAGSTAAVVCGVWVGGWVGWGGQASTGAPAAGRPELSAQDSAERCTEQRHAAQRSAEAHR
jgi:hypothetical protein